ncbi:MAG TPA: Crp/Fnr family transcriptional regulator [Bacteroidales bacterium]|nr:Crp/Fnr family transcriptional regulator [Bacteroidales bacterium]
MEAKEILEDCKECLFKLACDYFISQSDFEMLFQSTVQQNYKKGEVILKQGMKGNHLVYLRKGIVKFNYEDANGKNLILTISKSPTLLGLANILNEDVNIFSIIAIEECSGCLIDMDNLKMLAFNNQIFMLNILKMSTEMFRNSIFSFISLAHKQVYGRVADILIYLSKDIYQSNQFVLSLSRQEIAEFAGCSKENVIYTLHNFDSDGIIKVSGKKIEIISFERLFKISKSG